MTEQEFINREVAIWGFDYIDDLIERGYTPVLTTKGWYWLVTSGKAIDVDRDLCYAKV